MKAGKERLHETRENPEGKDLAAVCVSRDLKIDAVGARFVEMHGLVCEQNDGLAHVPSLHGARHVSPVTVAESVCRPVVDPSDVDHFAVHRKLDVLVAQHSDSQTPKKLEPRIRSRVVLVIARDEKGPEGRANLSEWGDGAPELFDRAVDQISRDRDDVGLEGVHLPYDVFDEIAADGEADVHVTELDEAEADAKENGAPPVAALVMECVLHGAGGMDLIDPTFQRATIQACRARGLPVVLDEVFAGIWRLGAEGAWELLGDGCAPDISCYAKLLTGGLVPLAITASTEDVFDAFRGPTKTHALLHGHSYTAYPVGCAVAADQAYRETDLAMLALFGAPHLPRMLDAYDEASPLAEGWQDRVTLHQLFPLLVHACLAGGGYGARAAAVARTYL